MLTPQGRRAAERIVAARANALRELLQRLSPEQRAALSALLDALMEGAVAGKDGGAWICRLCDLGACKRDEGRCPAANAAAAKYGSSNSRGGSAGWS